MAIDKESIPLSSKKGSKESGFFPEMVNLQFSGDWLSDSNWINENPYSLNYMFVVSLNFSQSTNRSC